MTWNYRIFKQAGKTGLKYKNGKDIIIPPFMYIGECYYDDKGNPDMHSSMDHNLLGADDLPDLSEVYLKINEAFRAPIIELDEDGGFVGGNDE